MRNGNKNVSERIFSSPVAFIIFLIVLILMGRSAWNMHLSASASKSRLEDSRLALDRLRGEKKHVSDKIDVLSTPEGVESELRSKYRAVRDGESVAVIIDDVQSDTSNEATTTEEILGWREKFLRAFWKSE
jgi:hypothetical protein